MKVEFTADRIDSESLRAALEQETGGPDTLALEVVQTDDKALETAIVTAIVTATAGVLKALVTSALGVAKGRDTQKIIVQTTLGRIEVPANLPPEQVDNLVARITPIVTDVMHVHLA